MTVLIDDEKTMPKIIGKLVCYFTGHKRGVRLLESSMPAEPFAPGYNYFRCPRCYRITRYKVKDENHGTPGDQA